MLPIVTEEQSKTINEYIIERAKDCAENKDIIKEIIEKYPEYELHKEAVASRVSKTICNNIHAIIDSNWIQKERFKQYKKADKIVGAIDTARKVLADMDGTSTPKVTQITNVDNSERNAKRSALSEYYKRHGE